jgi:hypothetical protein
MINPVQRSCKASVTPSAAGLQQQCSRPEEGRPLGSIAPGLVETQFSGFRGLDDQIFTVVLLLVLDGWDHSDLAVKSSVIEPVDLLGDGDLDVVDALPRALVADQFCFEQRVERLRHGIIVQISFAANRIHGPGVGQAFGAPDSEVLNTSVEVMNQVSQVGALAGARPDAHLQSIQRQVCAQRGRDLQANDPAREHVQHECGVHHPAASTRQIHILTTRDDLPVEQVIYRMGSRWRQDDYFRYAPMHFDLDSHDAYATTDDDPTRLVPNPAKKKAHKQVLAARARYERALAATDAAMLDAVSPPQGQAVLITNADHDRLTADLRAAESSLDTTQAAHRAIAARLPLGQVNPGQQVLDIQTKLISHAIRIAAFNTATTLARAIRVHTSYARANREAHTLIRQALTGSGDIDPHDGFLTVRLDPLPTRRATKAIAELCEHLTTTKTRYPGTDLILRYEIKTRP